MIVTLGECANKHFHEKSALIDVSIAQERIMKLRKGMSMISVHACGGVLDCVFRSKRTAFPV